MEGARSFDDVKPKRYTMTFFPNIAKMEVKSDE